MTNSSLNKIANLKPVTAVMLIMACTVLIYGNSLKNGFVWDDRILLVPNEAYQNLNLVRIFTTRINSIEYLPFRDLSYAIDYKIWGMNPFGFHLTNVILYVLSLAAFFKMIEQLVRLSGEEKWETVPAWTTLIFALHPLHAEVVNFIHGRNTILAGLFLFLSCAVLINGFIKQKNIFILLSLVLFIMSLFSKAIVIFFPFFLAVLFSYIPESAAGNRKKVLIFLLFLAVDILATGIHYKNASSTNMMDLNLIMYGNDNWWLRLAKASQIPFFYLKMYLLPYPLTIEYPVRFLSGAFIFRSISGGLILAVFVAVAWLMRRKYPLQAIAIIWTLLSLGPVSNLFPTTPVVADRYAYLPVAGFGLLTASIVQKLSERRKIFLYAALGVAIIWSLVIFRRNTDWYSDVTLREAAVRVTPDMSKADLAAALWEEGKYEEALKYFKEDRDRLGNYHYNRFLGVYLLNAGRYQEAIANFKEALARGGNVSREIHVELAMTYEKIGMTMEAIGEYLNAIETREIDPQNKYKKTALNGINRLRTVYSPLLKKLRNQAAKDTMDFQTHAVLGLLLQKLGMYDEAEVYYRNALKINPSSWQAAYNLGLSYMKRRMWQHAIESFEKVLVLDQKNKDALNNTGICYMEMQKYKEAVQYYDRALNVDPNFFYPAYNAGSTYFVKGSREKALYYFSKAKTMVKDNNEMTALVDRYLTQLR